MENLANDTLSLLNLSGAITARDTHYMTKDELKEVMKTTHHSVFSSDRGIYGLVHLMSVTDFSKQKALIVLLSNSWDKYPKSRFDMDLEGKIIEHIARSLPINRLLNVFGELRLRRVNNSRTRRLILFTILNSKSLELWSVKYRKKVRRSLEHAWGKRTTGIIKSILNKKRRTKKEKLIAESTIYKYTSKVIYVPGTKLDECISFVLGNSDFTIPLIKAFESAKTDLEAGAGLPIEVLEGIRSSYHKDIPPAKVLEIAKLTSKQKRLVQKRAKEADIEVEFDPKKYSITDLYIYAYENGMTDEIWEAIRHKARMAAKQLPVSFDSVGILLDDSYSMMGSGTQKFRPISIALGITQVLRYSVLPGQWCLRTVTSRSIAHDDGLIPKPRGETSLAMRLLQIFEFDPEIIFVISDGYENAVAGRFSEVVYHLREMNIETPIFHINPVATETTRHMNVPMLTSNNPEALSVPMLIALFNSNPVMALDSLVKMTLPLLNE